MRLGLHLLFLALLGSCSMVSKVAVKTTGSVISNGSDELLEEANWEHFKNAAPANLKMIEGLWFSDQENKELLTLLIKGYGAYGFGVAETQALENILLESEQVFLTQQAVMFYQKAIYYGEKYLALKGIKSEEFWDKNFPEKLEKVFNENIDTEDYVALFYFAQSLGSSINIQRQNLSQMAKMNHALKTMNWVCAKAPHIERDGCSLYEAIMAASLPSIMGGDQAQAKAKFLKIIKERPYDLLAHESYIQYQLLPMMDEEELAKEMKILEDKSSIWYYLQLGMRKMVH